MQMVLFNHSLVQMMAFLLVHAHHDPLSMLCHVCLMRIYVEINVIKLPTNQSGTPEASWTHNLLVYAQLLDSFLFHKNPQK